MDVTGRGPSAGETPEPTRSRDGASVRSRSSGGAIRFPGSNEMPDLLTQDEAVSLLRLDQLGVRSPKETLRQLQRTHQLGYVKVAGKVLIPRGEIYAYLERHTVHRGEHGMED